MEQELLAIVERVAASEHSEADIEVLREALFNESKRSLLQLGKYNINIGEGGEGIHIGDRTYVEIDEEAIRAIALTIYQKISGSNCQCLSESEYSRALQDIFSAHNEVNLSQCQLPSDILSFIGRKNELRKIERVSKAKSKSSKEKLISSKVITISGMAGVGKSALAIHVSHKLTENYPDAQFYYKLRDIDGKSVQASDILLYWLITLGIAKEAIPNRLEERTSLFRSCLADKRTLILLDDAQETTHIRSLLPGKGKHLIIITSRRKLAALEATHIQIDTMPMNDARKLLAKISERTPTKENKVLLEKIIRLCGSLPLAIRIAGGTLALKQHWTLSKYLKELEDERNRLNRLNLDDLDIRASIELSYKQLSSEESYLFRFASLLPDSFMNLTVSTLIGWQQSAAADILERLVDVNVINPVYDERYEFHSLVHLFAKEKHAAEVDGETEVAAKQRLVDQYLDVVQLASASVDGRTRPDVTQSYMEMSPSSSHTKITSLNSELGWLTWAIDFFMIERTTIMTAVSWCYQIEDWESSLNFSLSLFNLFDIIGYWPDWEKSCRLALDASRNLGSQEGEARVLSNLGVVCRRQGRWQEAVSHYKLSKKLFNQLNLTNDEMGVVLNLGVVYQNLGRWEDAKKNFQLSLRAFRQLKDKVGEYKCLLNLGIIYRMQCSWKKSADFLEKSLEIAKENNDIFSQSQSILNIGNIYLHRGLFDNAAIYYEQALEGFRLVSSTFGESQALSNLAPVYYRQGKLIESQDYCEQSLQRFDELGDLQGRANMLLLLSSIYKDRNRASDAKELLEQCLELYSDLGDRCGELSVYHNLGNLHLEQGEFPKSKFFYDHALTLSRDLGDKQAEAGLLRELGTNAYKQQALETAIDFYLASINAFKELDDTRELGLSLHGLAVAYSDSNSTESLRRGISYFQKSIEAFQIWKDVFYEGRANVQLSMIYLKTGNNKQAIKFARRGLELLKGLEKPLWESQALMIIGHSHMQSNKWQKAAHRLFAKV